MRRRRIPDWLALALLIIALTMMFTGAYVLTSP